MDLLEEARRAGVVGAGGAGFPTYAKLNCRADYLLVNGAECEPLLRVDQLLMARWPDQVILGAQGAAEAVGAENVIIGVKGKHKDAIEQLENRIAALGLSNRARVGVLPDIYPAGDEVVLVYQLTGRIVPELGLPKDVGCVVVNAETCLNLYRAQQGQPLTEKYVTITGDVPAPKTVRTPIGTPIRDLLRLSGVERLSGYRVIRGGPMMGSLMETAEDYVSKTDKGFILLKETHPLVQKKARKESAVRRVNRSACEQCRMCTDLCPRFLLGHRLQPHKLMRGWITGGKDLQPAAALCSQCGLCEYFSCPANLYPRMNNIAFKQKLAEESIRYQPGEQPPKAHENRPYRLIPSHKLTARLGLGRFDHPAPWSDELLSPIEVRIATKQHIGAAAKPVVQVGQRVSKNQVIGEVERDRLGVPIHASIDGVVTACDEICVVLRKEA